MSGNTPGPWGVCLDIGVDGNINVFAPDEMGKAIALIDVREHADDKDQASREEALSNARLIAAAPELLNALVELLAHAAKRGWWLESHAVEVMNEARAAIAKAEGR